MVPAYNAAATVLSTLSRLGRQSFRGFEVIVVDDGSTDETASIVEAAAGRDARIRLIRKANGGVSSARNVGLGAVTGTWVLFLDADDWLDDTYLARMLAAASAEPGSRVVCCRHARVATSGALITGPAPDPDQDHFFDTLAQHSIGAIHAYLTDTALVREVGGFDENLRICEDWDLWQRIARTGARLATVPDVLAYYRMRTGSLTSDGARLLSDARTVLRRGMSADPRVARPAPRWAHGVPAHDVEESLQPIAVWCATTALVGGRPWRLLLDEVQDWGQPADDLGFVDYFFEGFLLGHGLAAPEVAGVVDKLESAAADIFDEVATRTHCPQLATSWRRRMADIFAQVGISGLSVRNLEIPTDGLVPSLPGAPGGEHLVIRLRFPGRTLQLLNAVHWLPIGRADMAQLLAGSLVQRTYAALHRRVVGRLAPKPGLRTNNRLMGLRRGAVALIQTAGWRLDSDYEGIKTERASAMLDGLKIDQGAIRTRAEVSRHLGYEVPILMYHRVTDQPNPALAQWAVSPAAFERQMDFLRRRGFHTMSMRELAQARGAGRPLAGRPVILTFDDAYVDFAEHCLPVLRRKGFGATVFAPTNHLGGGADWDARFGPAAPIMDRAQLFEVAQAGIELGSHLHTHTRVDHLSFNELLQEALESRRIIADIAGTPPRAIATPYGFLDAAALSILRTAGFELVATTDQGLASLLDAGRVVPRLEVSDGSLANLHALLAPVGCEPPTVDELAVEADGQEQRWGC